MFDVRIRDFALDKAVSLDSASLQMVGAAVIATVALMSIGAGALALTGRGELKTLRLEVAAARDEAAAARQRSAAWREGGVSPGCSRGNANAMAPGTNVTRNT